MVGALKNGVEILWLLVLRTHSITPVIPTSLVMLLSRTKSAYGGSDMLLLQGCSYELEVRTLQNFRSYCCDEVAALMVLLFTDVTCVRRCMQ